MARTGRGIAGKDVDPSTRWATDAPKTPPRRICGESRAGWPVCQIEFSIALALKPGGQTSQVRYLGHAAGDKLGNPGPRMMRRSQTEQQQARR